MSKKVKVSVLVTFHNQENNVVRALDSVKVQETSFDYEIIVGDDHSTDYTVEKIKEWSNYTNFSVGVYTPDIPANSPPGFRASRNRMNLLSYVKGDYFIFLDGDDAFCDKLKLQKQYEVLEKEENADCVACGHSIVYEYAENIKKNPECQPDKSFPEQKISLKEYWRKYYFHTNTILFRSSIICKLQKDLLINNYNDNMITLSALQFGKIYYLPICAAVYVQTGSGIWTGEKKDISLIRNMFLYDLANIINPSIRFENDLRSRGTWIDIYKRRKYMSPEKFSVYYDEACSRKLKYSMMWINYSKLTLVHKFFLLCRVAGFYILYLYRLGKSAFLSMSHRLNEPYNAFAGNNAVNSQADTISRDKDRV